MEYNWGPLHVMTSFVLLISDKERKYFEEKKMACPIWISTCKRMNLDLNPVPSTESVQNGSDISN